MKNALLFIFLLAFLIRLIALNQSLWLDEATTAKVVQSYSFIEIVTKFSPFDFHPPLYYLFMKIWTNVFGYSEIALRFPSVIFSLLTGWVVYKICRLRLGFGEPLWAAAFFLFNPLIVYYSQEARMYMMATFLLTVALYFYLVIARSETTKQSHSKRLPRPDVTSGLAMTVFLVLSFLTFYGSIFLIIPMLLYLIYKKQYKYFFVSCFMLFVLSLILSPLLYQQFNNAKKTLSIVLNWKSVLGTASIKNLLLIPLKFSFGRISFYPKWLYYLVSGIWTVFVWFFVVKGGLKNKTIMVIMVMTIITGLIFSFFTPLLQYFRFLYLLPLMSLLLAQVDERPLYDRAKVVIIGGFLILSLTYLFNPVFHREDWKSLAKTLPQNQPVYMIASSSDPLRYYRPEIKIIDLKFIDDHHQNLNEAIVIPYTFDIYRINYHQSFAKNHFYLSKTIYFRGLMVEFWFKKIKV